MPRNGGIPMGDDQFGYSRRSVLKNGAIATGAIVLGGTAATGTAAAGIGDGRVGHYPLNNVRPDGTVPDASPNRNTGAVVGDVSIARGGGNVGNAMTLSGGHVEIADDDSLGVEEVTIAAWVKPDGTKAREYIFDGRNHQYGLKENDGTEVPRFFIFDDEDSLFRVDADAPLPEGVWTHVAATYDGESMTVYLDGEARGTNTAPSRPIGTSAGPARIGNYIGDGYSFSGSLDEVRVYSRALSESEIQSLAAMGGTSGGNSQGGGNGPR